MTDTGLSELQDLEAKLRLLGISGYYFAPLVDVQGKQGDYSLKILDKVNLARRLSCKIDTGFVHYSTPRVKELFDVYKRRFIQSDPDFSCMKSLQQQWRVFRVTDQIQEPKRQQWLDVLHNFGFQCRGARVFSIDGVRPLVGVLVFFSKLPEAHLIRKLKEQELQFDLYTHSLARLILSQGNPLKNPWVALGAISSKSHKVLQLLSQGMDTQEIADVMQLTKRGVDYHIDTLKALLLAKTRAHLIAKALEAGIIDFESSNIVSH